MAKVENVEMVEVTAPEPKPSAPGAPGIVYVTDKAGRRIGLKKLKPSARFMLSEACDVKTQSGEIQRLVAATVFSIDEEAYTPIRSQSDLLSRLDDIGDDGLQAITVPVLEMYGMVLGEKDIEAAKNS